MSTARIVVGAALSAGALVFLAPTRLVTPELLAAEQYFGCPTGYTFQTKSSGARFSSKVQPGPDVCTKTSAPSIIAPAVAKSL